MKNQSRVKVGVVGTGFGEKIHIPGLQKHPQTEVLAVYHREKAKAKAIAQAYDIPFACSSIEEMLAIPDLDGVTLATPPFLHYEMAKKIISASKHLLLEKPMTLNVAKVRELQKLAQRYQVIVVPDFEFRFIPAWQLLAEYLNSGYVGKKYLIKVDWLVASRANPERPWNWYSRRDLGGGVLGAIGSHCFDYLHWLFGPAKSLCGYLGCAIPQRRDPREGNKLKPVDADDTNLILMELMDGTPCQISLSSVTNNGRGHWLEVYGDQGTLVLGSDNLKDYVHGFHLQAGKVGKNLTVVDIPKRLAFPEVFTDGRLAPFIRVVDHWVSCIETGENGVPSLTEGIYSQLLMDLTHQSHEQKRWVEIS